MRNRPRLLVGLDVFTVLMLISAVGMVFLYAPVEAVMGAVQKVFYFHVAAGWVGMLSFLVAAVSGGVYLGTRNSYWDVIGFAAVEVGMVFLLINVISGSIWARPIWNTWWTWDPRLTTAVIMVMIYAAYLLLRQGTEEPGRKAIFGAVYAIIGFISVPLTFISIRVFRTIHPVVLGSYKSVDVGMFGMTVRMTHAFIFSLVVFTFVYIDILWHRIRLGLLSARLEELKQSHHMPGSYNKKEGKGKWL